MGIEFKLEMLRFLPKGHIDKILGQQDLWDFITYLIEDLGNQIRKHVGK